MLYPGQGHGGSGLYPGNTEGEVGIQPGWDAGSSQCTVHTARENLEPPIHLRVGRKLENQKETHMDTPRQ